MVGVGFRTWVKVGFLDGGLVWVLGWGVGIGSGFRTEGLVIFRGQDGFGSEL